ncbi:hypothetical protein ACN09D_14705 [Serratia fonticola]|uniref:hypothetical protein n=1 Tax=Serratia fonticola TaxID=47917 RepID=UPI003AF348B9
MSKIKITLEDAKAELRDAATGPRSEHWSYAPAVKALLNSHDELLAILGEATVALEEKDQQIKELEVTQMTGPLSLVLKRAAELERIIEGVDQLAIDGGWTARGLSEHAKSLETRNAELERANTAQDDHINQQQDRIDTLEKKNDELGKHIGKQEKLLKGTEESLIASVDMVAELERLDRAAAKVEGE